MSALPRGASLFDLVTHRDARGELIAFDEDCNLGFALKRVFYVRGATAGSIRAEHACSAEQVLMVLHGSVTVYLDNGGDAITVRLVQGGRALWLSAGMWLRLEKFSSDALLSVAASRTYADTIYFQHPQPGLIAAA